MREPMSPPCPSSCHVSYLVYVPSGFNSTSTVATSWSHETLKMLHARPTPRRTCGVSVTFAFASARS